MNEYYWICYKSVCRIALAIQGLLNLPWQVIRGVGEVIQAVPEKLELEGRQGNLREGTRKVKSIEVIKNYQRNKGGGEKKSDEIVGGKLGIYQEGEETTKYKEGYNLS